MAIDRLTLSTFRNHADSRLDGTRHFNLLVGENGAGKTNVLEAISLLAPGRGLRRAALSEMAAADGDGGFAVSAQLDCGDGSDPVLLATGMDAAKPGRRIVHVNGAHASTVSLGEWLAIGWLTPTMDRLFTESAGARRRFMDRMALALDPGHARIAARYESALRERNRLLSEAAEPDPAWLEAIEAQLGETGSTLASGRRRLVKRLEEELTAFPNSPFARPILAYVPGGPDEPAALTAALRTTRRRDRTAQRTLTGPHRDELEVKMSGKAVPAARCSTGEQKAMLIAITLAHAALAARGRPSLLLLDEVAAHLDPVRRSALFARLRDGAAQVWLTGTERMPFKEIASDAAVWQVSGGQIQRMA